MRTSDLHLDPDLGQLLAFDAQDGAVRFAGRRVLILDVAALGLLRQQLVHALGGAAARAVLTRFGFAHGWRMAEALQSRFGWERDEEWRDAGGLVHTLQGYILLAESSAGPLSPAGATLASSYEAEQHLLHLGRADEPVCWTLAGLASGYMSRAEGTPIYVLEDRCVGRGDAACHFVGRTRAAWGAALGPHLRFFEGPEGHGNAQWPEGRDAREARDARDAREAPGGAGGAAQRGKRRPTLHRAGEAHARAALVAESEAMRRVLDRAVRVAGVDSTVLITGESGVGKERIARLIHERSARASGPLLAVSCGAVAETLLESELFGHARGAFTGATQDRVGLFEAASGGTLFLDEVGELSASMQVRLLRVLQEREVRRVGENHSRPVDVRVLSATHRDLGSDVVAGRFRRDLYYRLHVVALRVPPLRERSPDILPLAHALLADVTGQLGRTRLTLGASAVEALLAHDWPGNVRELENALEHAVALAQGDAIEREDLPEEIWRAPSALAMGPRRLADVEQEHILAAFARNQGKQAPTAQELGISTATLYRKLKRYGALPGRATSSTRYR
jgi:two-component system response regulator HydG